MKALVVLLFLASVSSWAQEAVTADPLVAQQRLAAVLRQATTDYERGDYKGAAAKLDTLQGAPAGDLTVLNLRAAALTKLGDHAQAAKIFSDIIEANPDYFPAAYNLAEVRFLGGDREGALDAFRQLRLRDPRNELLRFKVFLCQYVLGRDEEAAKTARAMQSAGSTPAWYYAQALIARRAGDEAKARKNFRAARSLYGDDACRLFDESLASAGL